MLKYFQMGGTIIRKFGPDCKSLLHRIVAAAVLLLATSLMMPSVMVSAPARLSKVTLYQPDGSSFTALLSGDEHVKVMTTEDGIPLVQEEDGTYCYAYYEADGRLYSTGTRAGSGSDAMSRMSSVPYDALAEKAAAVRRTAFTGRSAGQKYSVLAGVVRVPVLLVAFKNLPFTFTKEDFDAMLNSTGYSVNGSTGSARDYFRDQFLGRVDFQFDVSDIITLSNTYSYYGRNDNLDAAGSDIRVGRMIYDACTGGDSSVDFSQYDNDKDGELDAVIVIFAGGDEAAGAGADHIWSKSGFLEDEGNLDLTCDGVSINCYACTSELLSDGTGDDTITNIGTFCHEFCHTLGLPDFYDRNGLSEALWGRTSIMDRGNSNNDGRTPPNLNAIERHILGLTPPDTLSAGQHTLSPVNSSGRYMYSGTGTEGEYFLFECREATGWDAYIGGSGMLIYHIDSSFNYVYNVRACDRWLMSGTYANTVNAHRSHQCADLQEADPTAVFSGTLTPDSEIQKVFFPSGDNASFSPASDPAFESWSGEASGMSVEEIKYESGTVSFRVYENEYSLLPSVAEINVDEFQDAAIVTWTADTEIPADVVLSLKGEQLKTLSVDPYESGKYSVTFEDLEPSTTYNVSISYSIGGVSGKVRIRQISTHPSTSYPPYIYLYSVARNTDGSFPSGTRLPLRLYNAKDAEDIVWTMDGREVEPDGSGYYVPEKSGMLRASAVFPDGTEYKVVKYIEVKGGE